jgi:hypothetical protein
MALSTARHSRSGAMTAYRDLPAEERGILLTITPSSYWLRVRLAFGVLGPRAAWLVGLANLVVTGDWLLLSLMDETAARETSRFTEAAWVAAGTTLFVLVPVALITLVKCLFRPETESWLPQRMLFTEPTILLTDGDGRDSDAGWSTVQEARLTPDEIHLMLSREPLQVLYIHRKKLGEARFKLLTEWLQAKATTST